MVINIPYVERLELFILNFLWFVSKAFVKSYISFPEIFSMAYFLILTTILGRTFPTPVPESIEEMLVSSNINAPYFPTLSHLVQFSKCVMKTDMQEIAIGPLK